MYNAQLRMKAHRESSANQIQDLEHHFSKEFLKSWKDLFHNCKMFIANHPLVIYSSISDKISRIISIPIFSSFLVITSGGSNLTTSFPAVNTNNPFFIASF